MPILSRLLARWRLLASFPLFSLLSGCAPWALLDPKGHIATQERDLILLSTGLMLLVVIPVIGLTLWFAWRYRETNERAIYKPKWAHSMTIELVVWTIPCAIIIALGSIIWVSTHQLDPYKPLKSAQKPFEVEVIALNWKWLFIYPELGVASVNELTIPAGRPVHFRLTAERMMNSFFVPNLGGQIYAMTGMQTQLNLIADAPGMFDGRSAAFSGEGFSDMYFKTRAMGQTDFAAWAAHAAKAPKSLDLAAYNALRQPSTADAPALYAHVAPGLFDRTINTFMIGRMSAQEAKRALCLPPAAMGERN